MLSRPRYSLAFPPSDGVCAFPLGGNLQTRFRLFSHPFRDTFHLSFKLLVRYRSPDMFRFGRSGLPPSVGISSPAYSVYGNHHVFAYGTVVLFGYLFQGNSAIRVEVLPSPHVDTVSRADSARPVPVSVAPTSGIAVAFSSCPYHDASPQGVPFPGPFPTDFLSPSEQARLVSGTSARFPGMPRGRGAKSH